MSYQVNLHINVSLITSNRLKLEMQQLRVMPHCHKHMLKLNISQLV